MMLSPDSITRSLLSLGATGGLLATSTCSAIAAEKIQFFVGPFEPTIYIEDLETFADDGTIPERLSFLTGRFEAEQLDAIRTLLNTPYEMDLTAVSQFTYGSFGEHLLYQAGQIVQTESFRNGGFALRSGLLLAAANEPDCCTVLDIMRHYPLETIQIDMDLALQVIDENRRIFQLRDEVIAGVREIAVEQVQADGAVALPDYEPHAAGTYTWQRETITFHNPARSQPSLADLYLPEAAASPTGEDSEEIPVVIISHGVASDRQTFAYLAEHLASHGYGVVTLEHAETSAERFSRFLRGQEGPPSPESLIARPLDITTVLDQLTADPTLPALNLESVGVLGQSLGGYTALAAAGAKLDQAELERQCFTKVEERPSVNLSLLVQCRMMEMPEAMPLTVQDDRVQAVVAVNPVTSSVFGEAGLSQLQVPILMVSASDDYFAPMVDEQIMPFTWFTHEESYLVVMEHGTHFSFLSSPEDGAFALPSSFIGPTPELARPHLKGLSLAFFNRYLRDRTADEAFLTQAYLADMPQEPFRFDIIHNFFE